MKNKSALSSSGMFLSELLIAILVFAVAAAVCLQIFVFASSSSAGSSDLNHAVIAAQNGAECFKASNGDLEQTAALLGAVEKSDSVLLGFDKAWNTTASKNDTKYIVEIKHVSRQLGCIDGEVKVTDVSGESLYSLVVTAETLNASDVGETLSEEVSL